MSTIPVAISPRELFRLWYGQLSYPERKTAIQVFRRFVKKAEAAAKLELLLQSSPKSSRVMSGF